MNATTRNIQDHKKCTNSKKYTNLTVIKKLIIIQYLTKSNYNKLNG